MFLLDAQRADRSLAESVRLIYVGQGRHEDRQPQRDWRKVHQVACKLNRRRQDSNDHPS